MLDCPLIALEQGRTFRTDNRRHGESFVRARLHQHPFILKTGHRDDGADGSKTLPSPDAASGSAAGANRDAKPSYQKRTSSIRAESSFSRFVQSTG